MMKKLMIVVIRLILDQWSVESHPFRMHSDIDLLKILSEAHGISGHESEVRKLVVEEMPQHATREADGSGSVLFRHGNTGPKIMIAAHMDEIGFLVQQITDDGFLKIVPIGGWWTHSLPSQQVTVKTRSGRFISGIVGSKPPHLLPDSQKNTLMSIESLFIDVGAENREQAETEFGIRPGDPIAPKTSFTQLENRDKIAGKAFDNRAGLAAMIEASRIICSGEHPNTLLAAATVQEEVGLRGAKTITSLCKPKPDCAIILEAPPADDTPGFALSESQGRQGKGVQIRLFDPTAITNPALAELTEKTAIQSNIPYQLTVRRTGGTDAGAIHLAGEGIPCIVLGIPARYIHSHNGIIDLNDYRAAVSLTVNLVRALDSGTVARLTQYL